MNHALPVSALIGCSILDNDCVACLNCIFILFFSSFCLCAVQHWGLQTFLLATFQLIGARYVLLHLRASVQSVVNLFSFAICDPVEFWQQTELAWCGVSLQRYLSPFKRACTLLLTLCIMLIASITRTRAHAHFILQWH